MGEVDAAVATADHATTDPGSSRPSPLGTWALAGFHTAMLVAVVVTTLFFAGLAGNQLAALDTWVGVVAYLYLWAVTWWTNRQVIDAVGPGLLAGSSDPTDALVEATKWGGLVGLLVFLPALLIGVVFFVGAGGIEAVPFLLLAAAVGSVVSAGVGVVVGVVFAILDLLLVRLARAWLPVDSSDSSAMNS